LLAGIEDYPVFSVSWRSDGGEKDCESAYHADFSLGALTAWIARLTA
jgi:hypothetical protein